jgi:hypothetical protein
VGWPGQPFFLMANFLLKIKISKFKKKKTKQFKFWNFQSFGKRKREEKNHQISTLKVELGPPWSWAVGHWPSPHKNDEANLSIGDLGGPFHHCRDLCDLAKLMYFSHPSLIIYFSFLGHSEPAPTSAP